jgi:hypothetical protein
MKSWRVKHRPYVNLIKLLFRLQVVKTAEKDQYYPDMADLVSAVDTEIWIEDIMSLKDTMEKVENKRKPTQ